MNKIKVDWNYAWQRAREGRSSNDHSTCWDKRALSFARHVKETDYEKRFLEIMQPDPSWSVLNVGCGVDTLAVPLAGRIASVTALDLSKVMLDLLRQCCQQEGVHNITTIHGNWEDDWERLGVGTYDVVIASRSMVARDLREAVDKLNRAARKRIYVSSLVGDGPLDRRVFEAVGRELVSGPDYIYLYNLLYQMGIYATVSFITSKEWKVFKSLDDAVEGTSWMLRDVTQHELELLGNYLATELVPCASGWRFPSPKSMRWAVISWEKENG